jgi:hypothetical protein
MSQVEVIDVKVLSQDMLSASLWDDCCSSLNSPSQHDLSRCLVVLLTNLYDNLLFQARLLTSSHAKLDIGACSEAAVSSHSYSFLSAESEQLVLCEVRMQFNL